MKRIIKPIAIIVFSTMIISTAYSDDLSRQKYEAAHAAYQLKLSASLLEQTVNNYSPVTNPNGAATVLTAFDQLANAYMQANLPVCNYMNTVKQAYPSPHPFNAPAQEIIDNLQKAVQSVSLLQTISRGAASANLSSYSHLSDISEVVSHAGAITYAATVRANLEPYKLEPYKISEEELQSVQNDIYIKAQQAALMAINRKAGNSTVIANSEACLAAAGAIATFATNVDGALEKAMEQYVYQSIAFSNGFTGALGLIMSDSKNNPKSFAMQQQTYGEVFSAIFADAFSALINKSALQPYQNPINKSTTISNATLLIEGAYTIASGVAQMIMPDYSTNIVDAMNYASLLNSGLLDQRHLALKDLIFVMQELAGKN
jgi:hypothetical protein